MLQLKYRLYYILSLLTVASPLLAILLIVLFNERTPFVYPIAAGIACIFFLSRPINKKMNEYKQMIEYDEFGMKKKKGRYDLSKKEREAMDLEQMANMERIISNTTLKKITKSGSEHPEADMKKLIGLKPVKQKMSEMVARMKFDKQQGNKKGKNSMSGRHMVFYGAPGTGKTTVARILTGFLYQYGYIKKNKCVEIDGNSLKANTASDTATKVKLIIRQAYDGVLFIDEAYALLDTGDGCGAEAIATLIKEMEDNRDRFILIMAGYTNDMRCLLDANPGFESRIKEYIDFPDYNMKEMHLILRMMAKEQGFTVSDGAYDAFDDRMQKERNLRSYGNARTIRNVLDESLDRHALNFMNKKISKEDKFTLCECDIKRTLSRNNFGWS